MSIINIEHISKVYGDKVIFDDASFGIQAGDKIGVVGINGAGKSTLLRIIGGVETPDSGQIITQNGLRLMYVPQSPVFDNGATVSSFALNADDAEDWRIKSNLTELGITNLEQPIEELSGGQKRRVVLAKALAGSFDLLLLDEPTNHLDQEMINWLEDYLRTFNKTLLMVTHDRYFLDRVTNRILEISHGKLYSYDTDYSGFLTLKAEREDMDLASSRKNQSILRMELEWAKRGCRARSTKQRARLERLETLKSMKAPVVEQAVTLDSVETRMGKKTIEFHHVSKAYGDKKILDDFNYTVLKNQRLGIIGANGCGKSTLIKMIAGLVTPDSGKIDIGETVKLGYFAQEEQEMDDSERVIDYVKGIAEYISTKDGRISASQLLERFLFTPDMQYSPIGKLSGGEKRRLYLLGVLALNANVLLFDEAGNNLDIPTLTILEDYLNSFLGIVITVSHDRYFLDNVVDRIFELDGCGGIKQYEGGYTDYLESKNRSKAIESIKAADAKASRSSFGSKGSADSSNRNAPSRPAHQAKLKFTYNEQREFEHIDEEIAALEEKLAELEREIEANATNSVKLSELVSTQEQTSAALEAKTERWFYLQELAEKIEASNKQ